MLVIFHRIKFKIYVNGQHKENFVFLYMISVVKMYQLIFVFIKKNVSKMEINVQLEDNVQIIYK